MKRCRTCNRTFTDPTLSFCIDDGTPLTTEFSEDAPYRPPGSYVPPPGKPRRSWPWIVGILGVFFLAGIGLMIAAAIVVPRLARQRPSQSNPPIVVATDNSNQNETGNQNENENTDVAAPTD